MPRSFAAIVNVVSFGALGLLACPSRKPAENPTGGASVEPGGSLVSAPAASPSITVVTGPSASSSDMPTFVTAVKAPIVSDDVCKTDGDCAPVATCHATKCVTRDHAGTMPSGMLCTMDCRGGTLDCGFNHCGCYDAPNGKRCATLAGPK